MDVSTSRKRPRRSSSPSRARSLRCPPSEHPRYEDGSKEVEIPSSSTYGNARLEGNARGNFGNTYHYGDVHQYAQPEVSGARPSVAEQLQRYMELLYFENIHNRRDNIRASHGQTCKWLLRRPEYIDWRDNQKLPENHGFLWIKGNPGTGKSTIMKFALRAAQRERDKIVISYFFTARGEHLEQSVEGMFRSLLYQILEKFSDPHALFETLLSDGHGMRSLSLEALKDVFRSIVEALGQQCLICYIDALDECDEDDVRDMVAFFETVGEVAALSNTPFYVCFSSRHYPHITIDNGQQIVLEDQDEHHDDLTTYINSKLRAGTSKLAQSVRDEVHRKARGIFLWVVLVVDILNKEYSKGNIRELRNRLDEIPDELNDLFKDIVRRGTSDNARLTLVFQWILYSKRPLQCEELYFAILSGIDTSAPTAWTRDEPTLDDMQRYILDCSKGLAETTKGKEPRIQFIHETVRDYVRETALKELQNVSSGESAGWSHDSLKRCCERYITIDLKRHVDRQADLPKASYHESRYLCNRIATSFPFLEYAVANLLYHADLAHSRGILQEKFIKHFDVANWIYLHNLLARYESRRYVAESHKTYVFADQRYTNLFEVAISQHEDFNTISEKSFGGALNAAIVQGNEYHVALLLNNSVSVAPSSRILLSAPLELAVDSGHANVVKLLIERGARPHAYGTSNGRLIYLAASKGHTKIVQLLLNSGVDVLEPNLVFKTYKYGTALQAAAVNGNQTILELLIEHGAHPNVHGGFFGTALQAAAANGYTNLVKMLISQGATDDVQSGYYGTALNAAAYAGQEDVMELLLANPNPVYALPMDVVKDVSPLFAAIAGGHLNAVELLIAKGANVNVQIEDQGPALHFALAKGGILIVEFLLKKHADANARCRRSGTALSAAFYYGVEYMVALLLEYGADVNALSNDHGTALRIASWLGHYDRVKTLLMQGAEVDLTFPKTGMLRELQCQKYPWLSTSLILHSKQGATFGTALYAASCEGHETVVKLLLQWGADVHAQGNGYYTALFLAVREGYKTIVELLLAHGAEVELAMLTDASRRGLYEVVRRIMAKDVDDSIDPLAYERARAIAEIHGDMEMLTLLKGRCAHR